MDLLRRAFPGPGGAVSGDRDTLTSFPAFYRHWTPRLTGYLRAQTADARWVEAITRESLLAARCGWDELVTCERPGVWLFRVATTLLRRWQAKAREQCTSLDELVAGQTGGRPDVLAAVRGLPRRQREAVALHCLLEFPVPDVARILGVSEAAAATHVERARGRLTGLVGSGEGEGEAR
ncbi:RNA polymerase factor sigma-70 [Mycobacterium tuberculosis]|nr:RNA polymerase factor sigma-70 [Mycobacterium tuberculosis]